VRLQRTGVDHGGDGVGRIVKSVDELESQRHQQSKTEQEVRQDRRVMHARQVRRQTGPGIDDADNQHYSEGKDSDLPRTFAKLGIERWHGYWLQLRWGGVGNVGAVAMGGLLIVDRKSSSRR
jgi:hypothetical protein